jgi:hypothetical protein
MRCAAFTHATHEHFYLLYDIAARQLYTGNNDFLKANGITATVANKVNMVIPVLSTGTVVFT